MSDAPATPNVPTLADAMNMRRELRSRSIMFPRLAEIASIFMEADKDGFEWISGDISLALNALGVSKSIGFEKLSGYMQEWGQNVRTLRQIELARKLFRIVNAPFLPDNTHIPSLDDEALQRTLNHYYACTLLDIATDEKVPLNVPQLRWGLSMLDIDQIDIALLMRVHHRMSAYGDTHPTATVIYNWIGHQIANHTEENRWQNLGIQMIRIDDQWLVETFAMLFTAESGFLAKFYAAVISKQHNPTPLKEFVVGLQSQLPEVKQEATG
jgi:6-pyruvoyl-tetrahydropterin synthase